MQINKVIKFILKLSVSTAFIAWLLYTIDWADVWKFSKEFSILQIIVYIGFLLSGMLISSKKWQLLARFRNIDEPLGNFFWAYLTGTFINNFMPSFIGGDAYRAYQIGKKDKRYVQSTSSVVIDRITGLISVMILTIIFFILNFDRISQNKILLNINILVIASFLMGILAVNLSEFEFLKKIIRKFPIKISELLNDFNQYKEKDILIKSILMGCLFSLVGLAGANYILFWALGIQMHLLDYLSVIFLVSIVSSIPISINNIGVKEWAYITFFGFFGVSSSAVVAVAIISRVLQMIVSFFALPTYLKRSR